MAYPTNKEILPKPTNATKTLTGVNHPDLHNATSTIVEALQDKVGINSDTNVNSHDFKLSETPSGDKAVSKTATQTITNKTLTSPTINGGTINNPNIANATSTGTDNGTETLGNKTLTSPTITNLTNANHDHSDASKGGLINEGGINFQDTTVNNASTTKHGFLRKLTGVVTDYLKGDGTFGPVTNVTKFGGTGADGALNVTSGVFNIDLGGQMVFIKNYSSINVSGTGQVTFSNPHANGTTIILKSSGNVTITSSSTPAINAIGCGASGGTGSWSNASAFSYAGVTGASVSDVNIVLSGNQTNGLRPGNTSYGPFGRLLGGQGSGSTNIAPKLATPPEILSGFPMGEFRVYNIAPGSGGSGMSKFGPPNGGDGGRGGAGMIIECLGALNFTSTIHIQPTGGTTLNSLTGGDGGAGSFIMLATSITTNSGSVTVTINSQTGYKYIGLNNTFQ